MEQKTNRTRLAFLALCVVLLLAAGVLTPGIVSGGWAVPSVQAATVMDSGSCGSGLSFELNSDGLLTVSGNGSLAFNSASDAPWYANRLNVKNVVIGSGVTAVGKRAFYDCTALIQVELPDSVLSIGYAAFYNCTALKTVTLPASVAYVDSYAFQNCTGMTGVTIPEGVGEIKNSAFYNCTGLKSLTIPSTVGKIGDRAFYGCSGMTTLTITDGVTTIDNAAFQHCAGIRTLAIPGSVSKIGSSAFSGCTGLTTLTLGDGVAEIGDSAFYGCTALRCVTLPDSVTKLGNNAFNNCSSMTSATLSENLSVISDSAFKGCVRLTGITIPESVTTIGDSAFSGCTGMGSISIPYGVTKVNGNAFSGCTGARTLSLPDSVTTIGVYAFYGCTGLNNVVIPDSVSNLGQYAFRSCTGITSLTFTEGIPNIGAYAFYNCTGIRSLTIPGSVATIGDYAFQGCTGVTTLTIEDGVVTVGSGAFISCTGLKSVAFPESISNIKSSAFSNCTGLVTADIPEYVSSIGSSAFSGCIKLTSITLPYGVTNVGSSAFSGCTALKTASIAETVTKIKDSTFYNCVSLTGIVIPDGVTGIGDSAFYGCTALKTVEIAETVTTIGGSAFYGCTSLERITIPDGVTTIGSQAFRDCTRLVSASIAGSVTQIGGYAFYKDTSLASLHLEEGLVKIDKYAFYNCAALPKVVIPESVTQIGSCAFYNCTTLTEIRIKNPDTIIGSDAFKNCPGVIVYGADAQEIEQILLSQASFVYDGSVHKPTVTVKNTDGNILSLNVDYTVIYSSGCKVPGSYTVTVSGKGNYTGDFVESFTIEKQPLTASRVTLSSTSFPYNGSVQKPTVTVKSTNGTTLTENSSYTLSWSGDCKAAGTYTVTVTGIGYYCGTVTKSFTITSATKTISASNVTLGWTSKAYNGAVQQPTVTVKNESGATLKKDTDYTLTWSTGCKVPGTYKVTVSGIGDYEGTAQKSFTITAQPLDASRMTLSWITRPYTGTLQQPTVTVKNAAGGTMTLNNSYTLTYSDDSKYPGSYTVTVTAKGTCYSGTVTKTYTLTTQPLDASHVALSWTTIPANGTVQKPTVTVTDQNGTWTLTEGKHYTVNFSAESKNAGNYTVTVKGKGNFSGTVEKTYSITSSTQALAASHVTLSWTGKTYNGAVQQPTVTVKNAAGTTLKKDTNYTIAYSSGCKIPGTYTVTVTGKGSYTGTVKKSFTITAQPLDASRMTLSWMTKPYNGTVQQPTVTVKNAAGGTMTLNSSYTLTYSSDSKFPGTYNVTVKAKGTCYSGSVTKNYTLTTQPLDASHVTLSWTRMPYNGTVQKPTVTVTDMKGTWVLKEGTHYTVTYSSENKAPGTYTVTVNGKGNFTGTVNKTYTITKQQLAASRVTLSASSFTYDGKVHKPTVTVKNAAGYVMTLNSSYTVSYSGDCKSKGTYTVTVTGKGCYTGTVAKTFVIK